FGYDAALRVAVDAFLQSPGFLYRAEHGRAAPGAEALALTPHEVASRMSYFLWDSMPDAALFAAAAGGDLDTASGIEAQARRLLASPRAHEAVAHFQDQWMSVGKELGTRKDARVYQGWDGPFTTILWRATGRFLEHAFWERGSLTDLLTLPQAFVEA